MATCTWQDILQLTSHDCWIHFPIWQYYLGRCTLIFVALIEDPKQVPSSVMHRNKLLANVFQAYLI